MRRRTYHRPRSRGDKRGEIEIDTVGRCEKRRRLRLTRELAARAGAVDVTAPRDLVGPRPGQDQRVLGAGHDRRWVSEREGESRDPIGYADIWDRRRGQDGIRGNTGAIDRAEPQNVGAT